MRMSLYVVATKFDVSNQLHTLTKIFIQLLALTQQVTSINDAVKNHANQLSQIGDKVRVVLPRSVFKHVD